MSGYMFNMFLPLSIDNVYLAPIIYMVSIFSIFSSMMYIPDPLLPCELYDALL